jgi:hypothetical protein
MSVYEAQLDQTCWHTYRVQQVKVIAGMNPAHPVTLSAASLCKALREATAILCAFTEQEFHAGSFGGARRVVIWVRVAVEGQDYIAALELACTNAEWHVLVSGERVGVQDVPTVVLSMLPKLVCEQSRDVFLPEPVRHSSGLFSSVPGIEAETSRAGYENLPFVHCAPPEK